ncbi:TetR/AcrR family transcriptional regulator [Croceicoccus pelagius]|uniref:TetR/AcrR family transcriptional regulator n=1 Tax=Croceicoccus pelagius TaxID=1703341 RepID=UPI0008298C3E|nr:TetR/AcrR family transcriptional regulator [Croceicoccus pelagius]
MVVARRDLALRKIRPNGGPEDFDRWQQRKSSLTRESILDAAVDSLVESGYAGLSTNDVARRAGVSRGAMHHHFPNRIALVRGMIEHVFYSRMRYFLDDFVARLKVIDNADAELQPHVIAVELHWHSVQSREFEAYLRLAVAARNDPELAEAFDPAAKLYDEVWLEEMDHAFPQWRNAPELMRLASDFTQAVQLGLLINGSTIGEDRVRMIQNELIGIVMRLAEAAKR